MNDLIALQSKMKSLMEGKTFDEEENEKVKIKTTIEDYAGELYLLKLIFTMYEDIDGGIAK